MTMLGRVTAVVLQVALVALLLSGLRPQCPDDSHEHCASDAVAQCDRMVACAPVALAPEQVVVADDAGPVVQLASVTQQELASVTREPDPPPPRA